MEMSTTQHEFCEQTVYYLRTPWTDPSRNLAFEEQLLKNVRAGSLFLLWQNEPSVIIGRNQIAEEEVNLEYAQEQGIHVCRRSTGGGAVYHDLGNVNYSFILDYDPKKEHRMSDYAEPVVRALRELGVNAFFSGRNDILVKNPESGETAKVCGTAERIDGSRILSHGCILFDVDLEQMQRVLTPPAEKLNRHGIASVKSRVMNLKDLVPDMTTEEFIGVLAEKIPDGREVLPLKWREVL